MKINYGEAIGNTFRFSFSFKRWFPFFIVNVIFFLLALGLTIPNMEAFITMMTTNTFASGGLLIVQYIAAMAALFVVWALLLIYISAAIVHQSHKEKEVKKSWQVARKKFWSFLASLIVITLITLVISVALSLIPFIGPFLGNIASIIISIMFFFAFPAIVLKNQGFHDGLKDSYDIFKKNVLRVILIWIVIILINWVIAFVFAIPLMGVFLTAFTDLLVVGTFSATSVVSLIAAIQNNLAFIVIAGVIAIAGMSITQVFQLKAQTEFYKQFRKKKLPF
ncbi:MAG: glycerophosphoryl diester phosphodiesterase membrane domain-containing protein [Nanoarchaeota archaeon]|nr:glycerophosphoryl diester phosphodiesterase membrane domain-containing protein [Nanoarchaeota archaeon]